MLKPIQISAKAPIMPSMRVSTSVALSSRRMASSFGAALAAPDAAEVMAPPDPAPRRQEERRLDRKAAPRLKTARPCFVSLPDEGANSAAGLDRARLHAGADLALGDPPLVDDHVEVLPGDRKRREQDAVDLDLLGAASERLNVG